MLVLALPENRVQSWLTTIALTPDQEPWTRLPVSRLQLHSHFRACLPAVLPGPMPGRTIGARELPGGTRAPS